MSIKLFCLRSHYLSLIFLATSVFSIVHSTKNTASKNMAQLPKLMRAVGLYKYLPITDPNSLLDLEVNLPEIKQSDVLVEVKAVSVNPIDTKIRAPKPIVESTPKILGWDGSGVVVAKGNNTKYLNIGDEVFFTGNIFGNGTNAQYAAIDELLVAKKPKNLSFEDAAAMPLTSLTAFECLYDRLLINENDNGKYLLIINSGGGVGSIASQLAKNTGLKVIGTASREETKTWSLKHGADYVLNHTKDLVSQLDEIQLNGKIDYILVNFDPYPYWDTLMKIVKPQGKICLVVDSSGPVDIRQLKDKSLTLVSEMMATRMKYDTEDKHRQREILEKVSKLLDDGILSCTRTKTLSPINAANLRTAHKLIEDKRMVGKLVLSGFP